MPQGQREGTFLLIECISLEQFILCNKDFTVWFRATDPGINDWNVMHSAVVYVLDEFWQIAEIVGVNCEAIVVDHVVNIIPLDVLNRFDQRRRNIPNNSRREF